MNDLDYDIYNSDYMTSKVRSDDVYAQNLYAALCNNTFQKNDAWEILKDDKWQCTWQEAGDIVANIRYYSDETWYCSGTGVGDWDNFVDDKVYTFAYVNEGTVTDDIKKDLKSLGWIILPKEYVE